MPRSSRAPWMRCRMRRCGDVAELRVALEKMLEAGG